MIFNEVFTTWDWRPIRNCPGRYILPAESGDLTPSEVLRSAVKTVEYRVASARDLVVIARLDEGGLISYKRTDGRYLHTLNTQEGFERKLSQLGIDLRDCV